MKNRLSTEVLKSFVGDVLPVRLISDSDISGASIRWSVDGDAVKLRKFSADKYSGDGFEDIGNDRYRDTKLDDCVLVTFISEGSATLCAEVEGEKYTCEITSVPHKQRIGERPEFYIGDLHVHTTMEHSHDRFCARTAEFPKDTVKYMKDENKIDFSVVSDHGCCLDEHCFFDAFEVSRDDGIAPIIFAGSESEVSDWQIDRYGKRHKNSGEMVIINADAYANTQKWSVFYSELAHSPFAVVTLAHPQIIGSPAGGGGGVWNFSLDKNNTPEFKSVLRLIESGNGTDRSSNLINEYMYSVALDQGFKVSLTCSSDNHVAPWGYESCPGKTVIMAYGNTREEFLYAMRENRVYATESGNVKLYYTVNGKMAPVTIEGCTSYDFHVELDYFKNDMTTVPVKCEVISDYGKCVKAVELSSDKELDFSVESSTARYFYLRFIDCMGRKTWSCPVWTGRNFDKTASSLVCQYTVGEQENLKPIPKKGFTAYDELSGKSADEVISDNVDSEWKSGLTSASIVLDMQKEYEVRGVGHYPVSLAETNRLEVKEKMSGFAAEYEISVSCDGKNYKKCADGVIRIYGGEVIAAFEKCRARYVKFAVKSTVGILSGNPQNFDFPLVMNELTVFE